MKTVLPNAVPQCRDIEGYVDPTEPLRDEGPFGDHTGYYTLPSPHEMEAAPISRGEPYPVFHVTAITHRQRGFPGLLRTRQWDSLRP